MSTLDFPQLLLGVLRFSGNEYVSICHKTDSGPFCTVVCAPAQVLAEVKSLPENADIYFGVNPVKGPARRNDGRGKAEDVTRLAALLADLDFKVNGCGDEATARQIIDDLSAVLGVRPSAVTKSGGGLHVYWPIRDGIINDDNREIVTMLSKRWGRLVKETAGAHGASADAVFDLPRVLRVPGTSNCKHDPIPVVCHADNGKALTLDEIDSKLSEFVVDGETGRITAPKSDPDDWEYADETCSYAAEMISGWNSDLPDSGRHQWLLSQSVRLACAFRLGCITEADHQHGYQVLARRMLELRAATNESVPQRELVTALAFGPEIAAIKTDDQARAELGRHEHRDQPIDEEFFWSSRPTLRDLRQFARARRVGPWATLGCVLARVVAAIPPTVVLPPLVGTYASLNLFAALVGPSGAGKGGAGGAAADWLTSDPATFSATLGSGEGMAKVFAYKQRVGKTGPWIQIGLRASVLFDAPEVDNLIALTTRNSSTLLPQLRSAYSGEELGFSYADPARAVRLCAHRYRLCLTLGVQPGRGKALLDDADGGTPQRFLWLPTGDADAPDALPEPPAGHDLQRWPDPPNGGGLVVPVLPQDLLDTPIAPGALHVLDVPDTAREAIDDHRVSMLRGADVDPLDGHRLLCRLKVAAALMWLDGRTDEITDDDWTLAGIVLAVSDRTRSGVVNVLRSKADTENALRGRAEGMREVAKVELLQNRAAQRLHRVADNIVRKLKDSGGELARAELRRSVRYQDRSLFDEAELLLIDAGRLDKLPSDNSGPGGFLLRLSGEETSK